MGNGSPRKREVRQPADDENLVLDRASESAAHYRRKDPECGLLPRQEVIRDVCFPTVAMQRNCAGRLGPPSCIITRWFPVREPHWSAAIRPPHARTLPSRTLPLRDSCPTFKRTSGRPRLRNSDRAFWLFSPVCGLVGRTYWLSSSQTPSSAGTASASACSGVGSHVRQPVEDDVSPETKAAHPPDGRRQHRLGSAKNSRRIAETRHRHRRAKRVPLHATQGTRSRPRRPGAPSSTTMSVRSPRLIFTAPTATFRVLYVFLRSSPTAAAAFFTSMSPSTPARTGPPSRSSRRFPRTRRPSI